MDEVDGMSTGDRGGIPELIKLIKTTFIPIICICNDRDSPKVRSLGSHCYDLKFRNPSLSFFNSFIMNRNEIVKRLSYICKQENINATQSQLENLVEATDGDIRQV